MPHPPLLSYRWWNGSCVVIRNTATMTSFTSTMGIGRQRPSLPPPPLSPPGHTSCCRHRYLSLNRQQRHGKKYGYTHDECRLQICYSSYDLDLDEDDIHEEQEDMTFLRVQFDLRAIQETVREIFDDCKHLQYYDNQQWKPLQAQNMYSPQLQKYRGGKCTLQVRVPQHYDDDDAADNNNSNSNMSYDDQKDGIRNNRTVDDDDADDDGTNPLHMDLTAIYIESTIKKLVTSLKQSNYERCEGVVYGENDAQKVIYSIVHKKNNVKRLTKDWVWEQTQDDADLGRLILAVPKALDHMVHCIHYDILWEPEQIRRRYHNGVRRK
jgi:hypothetical protein